MKQRNPSMPGPIALRRRLALQHVEPRLTSHGMMLRFFSLLAAVFALFLVPVGMANGAAVADTGLVGSNDHAAHCAGEDRPQDRSSEKMAGCVSACSALPGLEVSYAPPAKIETSKAQLPSHQVLVGIHPEGETPPPRITPEI